MVVFARDKEGGGGGGGFHNDDDDDDDGGGTCVCLGMLFLHFTFDSRFCRKYNFVFP